MKPAYSTDAYGQYLKSFLVDEVLQQGERFIVSTVKYRKDADRLVEIERHVVSPEGYGDLDSAIEAAEASRLSYLQCAEDERAGAWEEVSQRDREYELAGSSDIDPFAETSGCNTRITYLYRDADNYKQHEEIVVAGVLTEQEQQELRDSVECEGFIPEQVGMRALQADLQAYGAGADHAWHEIAEISVTEDPTTFPGTAKELLAKFKETDWDPSASSYVEAEVSIGAMR